MRTMPLVRQSREYYQGAWRDTVVVEDFHFELAPTRGPRGESRGIWVSSACAPGHSLYLKPTKRDDLAYTGRAAREKICSDLARHANVCVPPVVLAVRQDRGDHEKYVCLSMRLYEQQEDLEVAQVWTKNSSSMERIMRTHLPPASSNAFAFNHWVGQIDHGDETPNNIHWGWDVGREDRSFVFLDYAMALGWKGRWAQRGYESDWGFPFPTFLRQHLDPTAVASAAIRISEVPDDVVRTVVQRVPDAFMRDHERDLIVEALLYRRDHLCAKLMEPVGAA